MLDVSCIFADPHGGPVGTLHPILWLSLSVVSDSATALTVAHQAPLSMGFSRQELSLGFLIHKIVYHNTNFSELMSKAKERKYKKPLNCVWNNKRNTVYFNLSCPSHLHLLQAVPAGT